MFKTRENDFINHQDNLETFIRFMTKFSELKNIVVRKEGSSFLSAAVPRVKHKNIIFK